MNIRISGAAPALLVMTALAIAPHASAQTQARTQTKAPKQAADTAGYYTDTLGLNDLDDKFDLGEIVITGLRIPKTLKDTPVQTRLITARDIERIDATDIQDLLRQEIPGLEFSYAMNQQTHLNFNGQGGQSLLFLVDGERIAGETMDDIDFSRLNMNDVERVEIVKGASSALYGSNAGGGVINLITKAATQPWRVTLDGRYGKHNEQRYMASVSAAGKYVGNVFSVNYYDIDSYDVHSAPDPVTRVFTTVYGNTVWNFRDRLNVRPAKNLTLTGRAGYFFRRLHRDEDSPERYRDYSAGLRAEWSITPRDRLMASYSFDQYDKSVLYRRAHADVRNYSNVLNSARGLYTHTFRESDALTAGADVMRDYMNNRRLTIPERSQVSADAFVQYDWVIDDRWEAVGAVRYDYFSDGKDSRLTPKVSVRYRPTGSVSLRAGYGMGFRAPTLKEKYYQFDMAGIWIVNGNPRLKPETSNNITLSADYTNRNWNITVSGYYNDISNRISTGLPYYRPDDPGQLYLDYVNLSDMTVLGAEVTVQGRWNNGLSAKATYAYTDERLGHDKDGNVANNQYIPARKHSLTARLDWEKTFSRKYRLTLSLSGRALSGIENVEYKDYYNIAAGTVKVKYPPYTLWKIAATQSINKWLRINLACDNILNYKPKYYYLNCPLTDGATLTAGISVIIP